MQHLTTLVAMWQMGGIGLDSVKRRLEELLDPANAVPEVEQTPKPVGRDSEGAFLLRLEHKLNLIIQALGIPLPAGLSPEILVEDAKELALDNRKIEAVVIHRDQTGAGLAEAKAALDEFLRQHRNSKNGS